MIEVLTPEVANRIAAGEVIDRPSSIVRELLDNALDAGSTSIDVHLSRGGLDGIRVVDDGQGMSGEDLRLCFLPHATSKVRSFDDLWRVRTLGFRGEALASVGICARLSIASREHSADAANQLVVEGGELLSMGPHHGAPGTVADVSRLFFDLPARRRFLKSAGAESGLCRAVFLDKAVAFPHVEMRLFVDGRMRDYLAVDPPRQRICGAYADLKVDLLQMLEAEGEGYRVRLGMFPPEVSRRDRRRIHVFVNSRRIQDFGLIQAVEYGFQGSLPGGLHPVAFVFVEVEPDRADFNIHPAKKEVRLRDKASIHHSISSLVSSSLRSTTRYSRADTPPVGTSDLGLSYRPAPSRAQSGLVQTLSRVPSDGDAQEPGDDLVYLGRAFGVFLVAQRGESLYLVDQHAAHERVIYERLRSRKGDMQELMFPITFEADPGQDSYLRSGAEDLDALGIRVRRQGDGVYEVTHLRADLSEVKEEDIVGFLLGDRGGKENLERKLYAMVACKSAVRDGDELDAAAARELLRAAFVLPEPRCPHGRPLWYEISREELLRRVLRIV